MRRSWVVWVLMVVSIAAMARPGGATGTWVRDEVRYIPGTDTREDTCSSPYGQARANVTARGTTVRGEGSALEGAFFCDVRAVAVAVGVDDEIWNFIGNGEGRVRLYGLVHMRGTADLQDPDCAAAALGFTKLSSSITPTIEAVLTRSAGETSSELLGNLEAAYAGLGIEIGVSVSQGGGTFVDEDIDTVFGFKCTNTFFLSRISRGLIHVYADAAIFDGSAACEAELFGCVETVCEFGVCSCTGPSPAPTPGGRPLPDGDTTPGGTVPPGTTPRPGPGGGTTPRVPRPGGGGPGPGGGQG